MGESEISQYVMGKPNELSIINSHPSSYIVFFSGQNEILRLDKDGMVFMGERITDAGKAYDAFMEAMHILQNQDIM